MSGYPTEIPAVMQLEKIEDGLTLLEMALFGDVQWLPVMTRETMFNVERDYRRYLDAVVHDGGFHKEVSAKSFEKINKVFAQLEIYETSEGSLLSVKGHLAIAAALQWLSKLVQSSGIKLPALLCIVFDD